MTPKIEFLDFIDGARAARGAVVIIDVFRACSTCCYAIELGAARIIPAGAAEEALELKRTHPEFVTLGERYGRSLCENVSAHLPFMRKSAHRKLRSADATPSRR